MAFTENSSWSIFINANHDDLPSLKINFYKIYLVPRQTKIRNVHIRVCRNKAVRYSSGDIYISSAVHYLFRGNRVMRCTFKSWFLLLLQKYI